MITLTLDSMKCLFLTSNLPFVALSELELAKASVCVHVQVSA